MLATLLTTSNMVPPANADTDDTFKVTAGYSVRHESNLFHLSDGTDPQAAVGRSSKSDDIGIATVGLRLDKRYSLQRVELEANLVDYRYSTFDYLDFTARNYAAAWRWQLTPALQGNLTSTRTEALNSFNDYTNYRVRNIRTDETHRLDGVLEVDGAWRLLGGVAYVERTNSEPFLEEGDNRLNTIEAGVRRDFTSGSSLSLLVRQGRGEYFNRPALSPVHQLDNGFDQREQEIRLSRPAGGKTTLYGRLAHVERLHDHFPARDYSGMVGNVSVAVRATDKILLSGGVAHELTPYQSDTSSYASTDRVTLAGQWRMTAKTTLRGQYDFARRDYRGAIASTPDGERSDTQRAAKLALEWQPYRAVLLSVAVEKEERDSNQPGYDFTNSTGTVSAQFSF